MARHIYRYRSIIDECPCTSDGRPSYSRRSTIVPITSHIHDGIQQQNRPYVAHAQYIVPSVEVHHLSDDYHQPIPYTYDYDSKNDDVPVAIAVAV